MPYLVDQATRETRTTGRETRRHPLRSCHLISSFIDYVYRLDRPEEHLPASAAEDAKRVYHATRL